ncbi:MAG: c-type cytochrome domain-containing protein [Planctomycetota bacterium]|jgi:uncharacterized membrane protein
MLLFALDDDGPAQGVAGLWLELAAQLHAAVIHFPVALLLVAALVEFGSMLTGLFGRESGTRPARTAVICAIFAALGGAAAAFTGWTFAERNPISERIHDLVELHRWFGVGTAAVAIIALVPAFRARHGETPGALRLYRLLLFVAAGGVGYAGHLGGQIVHGENTLSDPIRALVEHYSGTDTAQEEVDSTSDVPAEIDTELDSGTTENTGGAHDGAGELLALDARTLLAQRCVECHGPTRSEGSLRLDTRDEILGAYVAFEGDPDGSLIVERVELPDDDEERMPTEGDPLTEAERTLLRDWITADLPWPSDGEPARE